MNKILCLFIIIFHYTVAHSQNTFEKVIDTLGSSEANCIQETFDGGYVLCGKSNNGGNDVMIIKLDSIGTIEWAKVYSGPGVESAMYIQQTPDSGYMVNAAYDAGLYTKNWLLRLDVNGDTLWTKTFSVGTGATNVYFGNSMAFTSDTIYGLTGYYKPVPFTTNSIYFISCHSNGTLLANKIYNTSAFETIAYAIDNTFDNGFIISGYLAASASASDFYLLRTNLYGDTLWTRTYDYSQNDAGFAVQQTADSGFIVAGAALNASVMHYNIYVIKTGPAGDTLWTKSYYSPLEQVPYSIQQTDDGGYIICGTAQNTVSLTGDVYLIKTNANGDTLWTRWFGGNQADWGFFANQTKDGGYIICGLSSSFGNGGTYIIKTDSMGNATPGVGIPELNNPFTFTISPNPSSGIFTIQAKGIPKFNSFIHIYNVTNECVYFCELNNNTTARINLSRLPGGLYIARLTIGDKIISEKIIIQK